MEGCSEAGRSEARWGEKKRGGGEVSGGVEKGIDLLERRWEGRGSRVVKKSWESRPVGWKRDGWHRKGPMICSHRTTIYSIYQKKDLTWRLYVDCRNLNA
jgi:hypothetical protein